MSTFLMYLGLTLLLCVATLVAPGLSMILAMMWGALLIAAGIHLDKPRLAALFLANITVLALLGGPGNLFYLLAFFGIPAMVMGFFAFRQQDYYHVRRYGVAALVAGVSLYLGALYYFNGAEYLTGQINEMVMQASGYYDAQGWARIYQEIGLTEEQFQQGLAAMAASLLHHLPAIFYVQGLLAVFLMLWLASVFTWKQLAIRLKKKPFAQELMPWELAWLVNLGLALGLYGWDERGLTYYTGSNVLVVMAVISFYYGLASLVFRLKQEQGRGRRWTLFLVIILALFFPLSALGFLCILGIFDSLLGLRKPYSGQEV